MIANTDLVFVRCKEYQDKRQELSMEYEKKVHSLERFKGSSGYDDDVLQLKTKYEADLKSLYNEYQPGIMTVVSSMMDMIGNRTMNAPTTDQINLLNILKMKKKVTLEECQRAAETVKDNPLALKIVTEIANDHGILRSFDRMCPEMSSEGAKNVVSVLKNSVEDFLVHKTPRASRIAEKYYISNYGAYNGVLPDRRPFNTKEEFYSSMGIPVDVLNQFADIVDANSRRDDFV